MAGDMTLRKARKQLEQARRRLAEERASRCAPAGTIEFWQFEVAEWEARCIAARIPTDHARVT
jgi:5-formyltetrahydrofolate cyclo-ligase